MEQVFRLLIVEDEPATRRVLVSTLALTGFRECPMDAPESWEEFLELVPVVDGEEIREEEQYNVLFLDGNLWSPYTWVQALERLRRANRLNPMTILVWISGDAPVPEQLKDEFCLVLQLAKPFGPKDILRELGIEI